MSENIKFKKHKFALFFSAILGNAILTIPKEASIISLIISGLFGFLLYFISLKISDRLIFSSKKILSKSFLASVLALAFYIGLDSLVKTSDFSSHFILKERVSVFASAVLLALFVLYLTFKKTRTGLEFSLVFAVLIGILLLILLVLLFLEVSNANIFNKIIWKPTFNFKGIFYYFKECFLVCLIFPVYEILCFKNSQSKTGHFAIAFSLLLLALIALLCYGVLGSNCGDYFEFPLANAVSVLNVGKIFTRLDGLLYYIVLFTSVIKIYFCSFVIKKTLEYIKA